MPWGLTPLEDQQLGGLIMWVPASTSYIVAGLALMGIWLQDRENPGLRQGSELPANRAG
jgi:cytochrome c oxidase assembly factor CtaG